MPTIGPLLEIGVTGPLKAAEAQMEGRDSKYGATVVRYLKGITPGSNAWYARAALDHLIWMQAMEAVSPGYLASVRQRTQRETGQQWWWQPGELTPDRAPDLGSAIE